MNEWEASQEARRRNEALPPDERESRYWIEVEHASGVWDVELREEHTALWKRIFSSIPIGPWS